MPPRAKPIPRSAWIKQAQTYMADEDTDAYVGLVTTVTNEEGDPEEAVEPSSLQNVVDGVPGVYVLQDASGEELSRIRVVERQQSMARTANGFGANNAQNTVMERLARSVVKDRDELSQQWAVLATYQGSSLASKDQEIERLRAQLDELKLANMELTVELNSGSEDSETSEWLELAKQGISVFTVKQSLSSARQVAENCLIRCVVEKIITQEQAIKIGEVITQELRSKGQESMQIGSGG
jgi:hypothetical protein